MVWVLRVAVVVIPLLLWEWGANRGIINTFLFSKPSLVYEQLVAWLGDGTIADNVVYTLFNAIIGYALGSGLGIAIAVLFAVFPKLGRIYTPFITTLNAIPRFAFAPLFAAVFGFSIWANISLVIVVVMFVSFFAVSGGLQSIDQDHLLWARSLGASQLEEWKTVRFPALVRWVIASLRVTVGLAVSAAIVSEFVGASQGIGYVVSYSNNLFQTRGVYAGIVVVIVVAATIDALLRWAERRWAHWVGQ